ncbi:MAG: 30S ribosomal protein S8 [Cyanobacteria bacterium QS_7_48_42]|jgi:small subunit ribosomal protein S8|nr:MAG: 30S ribosomal protein S8 [Cyanobacteria bacterium QH_10_48_56]PSO59736.1 MAG: 30S ribosomal protein S8 [Cyanobacteria bacterium QH_7_48_89]PSP00854.1 MAG: 30S ribosomal protein S8 [Cyanobacteria bacterium QS_7_48_42]PSP35780.1 MAG: 30S ribosomal protein S8 [Cyanobacteria bacterium QS_8_48_54]
MPPTDRIADMLTRIRNACMVEHLTTTVPSTKMNRNIARVLKEEGFITDYEEVGEGIKKQVLISLKYKDRNNQPVIKNLTRISRPGLRVYSNRKELPRVLGGIGIAIISTSRGIMTDREARRQGIGGEVLCYVW